MTDEQHSSIDALRTELRQRIESVIAKKLDVHFWDHHGGGWSDAAADIAAAVMDLFVDIREDATLRPGYVIAELVGADWIGSTQ